jgi:hypothetical protein
VDTLTHVDDNVVFDDVFAELRCQLATTRPERNSDIVAVYSADGVVVERVTAILRVHPEQARHGGLRSGNAEIVVQDATGILGAVEKSH